MSVLPIQPSQDAVADYEVLSSNFFPATSIINTPLCLFCTDGAIFTFNLTGSFEMYEGPTWPCLPCSHGILQLVPSFIQSAHLVLYVTGTDI